MRLLVYDMLVNVNGIYIYIYVMYMYVIKHVQLAQQGITL